MWERLLAANRARMALPRFRFTARVPGTFRAGMSPLPRNVPFATDAVWERLFGQEVLMSRSTGMCESDPTATDSRQDGAPTVDL